MGSYDNRVIYTQSAEYAFHQAHGGGWAEIVVAVPDPEYVGRIVKLLSADSACALWVNISGYYVDYPPKVYGITADGDLLQFDIPQINPLVDAGADDSGSGW